MADENVAPEGSSNLKRFLIVIAIGLAFVAAYWVFTRFIAYTDDAYVQSDLVAIAPQVAGIVKTVSVVENQAVTTGDPLLEIDPAPYQLAVTLSKDQVTAADIEITTANAQIAEIDAKIAAAQATFSYAETEFKRYSDLETTDTVSKAALDKTRDDLETARGALNEAKAEAVAAASALDAAKAAAQVARSQLAIDKYDLDQTRIVSPVTGHVNNLSLRPGNYADAGEDLIGIVDDSQWRIVANYKESIAASVKPGTKVWIWLDSYPWHLFDGQVQGIGRGIARDTDKARLLPYVAPTTNWIRLQRRLPVTITFDAPIPRERLFMGADARVIFMRNDP